MKKETVIRQNRCDQEMNFFLFGCFFLYMAMQLFVGDTDQLTLVNRINMALYFVFVPGFIFRIGYCFGRTRRLNSEEYGKKLLLKDAGRYYVYFFLLAFGQEVLQMGYTPRYSFSDILTVVSIPSISAVFFTMAVMLLTVRGFYATFAKLAGKRKKMIIVALLCLFSSLLWTEKESYALAAALFGSSAHPAVPAVPYFAYFLLGVWFEEKKPGFQWKMAAGAAAVTAVSLLLYRTPLQDLCRVTISFLPAYLVYVLSELLSDLTLRFEGARLVCNTIEPVFGIYATMLTCLYYIDGYLDMGIVGQSPLRVLLLGTVSALLIYGVVVGCMIFSRIYSKAVDGLYCRVKHKTAAYFVIYSVVFVFLFFVVFLNFIRFNKTFIWNGDGVSQYYPRAVYFARYIRELFAGLFSGNFSLPMYDFSLGFGSEITYSLEPLYFLYALAGEEHVELMYNLLTFLRLYLTGITSSILFLYFKKRYFPTFVASVAYVFCGFTLYGGIKHPMFMVAMIMLPLLIIAIEEILRNNRWYLCTVFVAISLFGNFYFIYMNTIAMGIYFLVRFFCQTEKEKKTIRNFMGKALEICGSYLLGVAMSCIVLVTTFGLYVSSGRSGEAVIKTPSLFYYQEGWLVRCLLSFLTTKNSPGEWLKLGFIPITFLALVFLFLRKGRKELKIFSAIAVVFMACPLFGFIFSGFSSVINRWCYMIALLAAFIVADCLPEMCRMKKRELKICGAAVGIYGFLAFFGNHLHTRFTKLAFICLVLTFVVLLLGQDSFKKISGREKQGLMLLLTVA
ncbi:MAG: YfhO family protein, partial [Candidatus Choladocola sp.]|nr:YfhO family protein [Candidatus Choladocola sp.]